MLILKAEHIAVERDGRLIFEDADFEIHKGEHIALLGKNGVGKTTFINVLMGEVESTRGKVHHYRKKEDWAVVLQYDQVDRDTTAREFVEMESPERYSLKKRLASFEKKMAKNTYTEKELSTYSELLQKYIDLDGYGWSSSIERSLKRMGLHEAVWETPFAHLSGGQKTRAKLARVMRTEPDLLVLDEPTNHLDAETMEWLGNWLQNFKGTLLFISHERAFIDQVAHFTYELTPGGTKKYQGGYSDYKKQKEHERRTKEAAYQKQQTEKRKLQEAVTTYKQWFQKAHNAASERDPFAKKKANKNITRFKAKEAALERIKKNKVEKPEEQLRINVEFGTGSFESKHLVRVEKMSFHYERDTPLFDKVSFTVERGDRMAVIGRNGTGKTTLLKLITGHLDPVEGTIQQHPQLIPGYFMQELEGLDPDLSVLQQIQESSELSESEVRTILACFLFRRDDVHKQIKHLSMGEKCRVAFVKLYFSEANLLVLDEPTNYLDIDTRERIEEALRIYPGTVVTVSHDTYLLDQVANRVLSLNDGFYDYCGTYKEWLTHDRVSPEQQGMENELERLKFLLSNLMSTENVEDETELKNQIRKIKERIQQINNDL
ncbi:ribosomal protection-like ABC-F family protein [Pseudalkalibacillus sp. SCS-8]|uniref:ribosomal protection-like ABC-F family protein n=1 Tax=Pseudalkalibacillus nanhaiensis TaxID=3115291 RepID=UPI0032DA3FF1